MKLTIPMLPLSPNSLRGRPWGMKKRLAKEWKELVRAQLDGAFLKPIVKMRCTVNLCHSRMYDPDNAYGAVKPVIDALKHWRLIVDDTAEYLELEVLQTKCPHKQRHTVIELEAA